MACFRRECACYGTDIVLYMVAQPVAHKATRFVQAEKKKNVYAIYNQRFL